MTLPNPTSPSSDLPDSRSARADAAYRSYLRTGDPAAVADLFDLAAADLHRTAMHLCGDDATAHDLVQTTFLVALERRGFDEQRAVLPWLGGILRNQATLVHRRRSQRLDRDRLRAEPSEDPGVRAAELELAGEVERALDQVPETYRPVVRLHVLHGLDAGAIAASLGRPGGTVRTQLMRGLEKLRALLPIGVAGVVAGLLPTTALAAVRTAVLTAAASGRAVASTTVVAGATRPPFLLLAVAGIATLALALWWWNDDAMPLPASTTPIAQRDAASSSPSVPFADATTPLPPAREAATELPTLFELRGSVIGTVNGVADQPVADAEVLLWLKDRPVMHGDGFTPPPAASVRTTADGTFALHATGTQCYLLARAPGVLSDVAVFGELDGRTEVAGLTFRLQPVVEQRGRLLDADGKPVPDFAFGTHRGHSMSAERRLQVPGFRRTNLPHLDVRTDAEGTFVVPAAAVDANYLWEVQHPRHPMLRVYHRPADGPVDLRLERGLAFGGVVWLPDGSPAAGAKVTVDDWPRRVAICDAAGRWDITGAEMRAGLWLFVEHPAAAMFCASVPQPSAVRELRLEAPRELAGRLVDAGGQPMANRELRLVGDRELDNKVNYAEPRTWVFLLGRNTLRTGPDGSFRQEALYDGSFRIELMLTTGDHVLLQEVRSGRSDLILRYVDRTARLRGKVLDATTGAPIEAGTIDLMRSDDGGKSWRGRATPFAAPGGELYFPEVATGLVSVRARVPGYATLDLPPRTLEAGEQRCDLALFPVRELDVEVWSQGKPGDGKVSVRTTDGERVMLFAGGPSYDKLDVREGRLRLERLPARTLVVTLLRGGEEKVERTVDLLRPRSEPLVFDLDAAGAAPKLEFALLLRTAARDVDTKAWIGRIDAAGLRRLMAEPALAMPQDEVKVTCCNAAGTVLATARLKPRDGRYSSWVTYPDGNGTGGDGPEATLDVKLRTDGVTLTTECEGFEPLTMRLLPHEVDSNGTAFLLVLKPR